MNHNFQTRSGFGRPLNLWAEWTPLGYLFGYLAALTHWGCSGPPVSIFIWLISSHCGIARSPYLADHNQKGEVLYLKNDSTAGGSIFASFLVLGAGLMRSPGSHLRLHRGTINGKKCPLITCICTVPVVRKQSPLKMRCIGNLQQLWAYTAHQIWNLFPGVLESLLKKKA